VAYRHDPFKGRYRLPGTGWWVYVIETSEARTFEVPEPYVRAIGGSVTEFPA
jgi:hypothetical protein